MLGVWLAFRVSVSSTIFSTFAEDSHQIRDVQKAPPIVSLNAPDTNPSAGPLSMKWISDLNALCCACVKEKSRLVPTATPHIYKRNSDWYPVEEAHQGTSRNFNFLTSAVVLVHDLSYTAYKIYDGIHLFYMYTYYQRNTHDLSGNV